MAPGAQHIQIDGLGRGRVSPRAGAGSVVACVGGIGFPLMNGRLRTPSFFLSLASVSSHPSDASHLSGGLPKGLPLPLSHFDEPTLERMSGKPAPSSRGRIEGKASPCISGEGPERPGFDRALDRVGPGIVGFGNHGTDPQGAARRRDTRTMHQEPKVETQIGEAEIWLTLN